MTDSTDGPSLLDLPMGILPDIAKHFTAVEWARGPGQVFHALYGLQLPCIDLSVRDIQVFKSGNHPREHSHAARLSAALKWAAKRIGRSTNYLRLARPGPPQEMPDHQATSNMLPGTPHLEGLRCIELLGSHFANTEHRALEAFTDWVLEHAASLEALCFRRSTPELTAGTQRFERLRHLTILPGIFTGEALNQASQLPALETLYMDSYLTNNIDVSGCKRLRRLVVRGSVVVKDSVKLQLLKGPACRLVIDMCHHRDGFRTMWWMQHRGFDLGLIDQLQAVKVDFMPGDIATKGLFAALHRMEILTISWPAISDAEKDGMLRHCYGPNAYPQGCSKSEQTLVWCMPENGMPVCNLQVLIINGKGNIKIMIPGALPNLRELVIYAKGRLELSFEQPAAMWMQTCYAFGQLLFSNLSGVSQSLAQRSMVLDVISAQHADEGERLNSNASCIYLKPIGAPDMSVRELLTTVERLANKCRCGACFACLREAGCITGGSSPEPAC